MQIKSLRKSFWQPLTALIGVSMIVGTGSAQTVSIDLAPALNLRTAVDGTGLALSSISIDPTTGNAQVKTTSNVTSCGIVVPPPGRSVVVAAPGTASQSSTINVTWVANNFVGATTCNVSLGAGSAVPAGGWAGVNLAYPGTSSLSVVLSAAQPATYNFVVQCSDSTAGPSGNAVTNIAAPGDDTCLNDSNIKKWRGTALNAPGSFSIWETTFIPSGSTAPVPFPGTQNRQFSAGLPLGEYDAMRFTIPFSLPIGSRYDLSNFVSTESVFEGVLASSVSPCEGDFRESFLTNQSTRKFCLSIAGVGGSAIGVVVDAGAGPYNAETCEVVRGRNYFLNTTFGTTNTSAGGAYCVGDACIYRLEYRLARRILE